MREVRAYIQPFMLDRVIATLVAIPEFPGISVVDARGFGYERAESHETRAAEELTDFTPKSRLEIVVPEEMVDRVVNAIASAAHTGRRGDGKIFVSAVQQAVRVRTGEKNEAALRKSRADEEG